MDFGAVMTATALASALMTAVFALATNWPIALAPGMG
jgi:xanthine/uracil/vitamin C permease (AzgA family)